MKYDIAILIEKAAAIGASDIHLIAGEAPQCRVSGELEDLESGILTPEDCEDLAKQLAGASYNDITSIGELDFACSIAGERIRVNLFRQQGSVSTALRILSNKIPELKKLGLPPVVDSFPKLQKGIVLVTGETGSGKSTTLAALLNEINLNRRQHIITLEDPIEYIYKPVKCSINQREIGRDTRSYGDALRAVLREDPDIILIGEMRDLTTIETALTAAETGHLVFSTLHTNSAADSVDRIVGIFPSERQTQVRMQLSMTLKAILSQQLLRRSSGKGRVCACECMIVTPAIQNLIREGKTPQMASTMLSNANVGSITMDNCLIKMAQSGEISPETAVAASNDAEYLKKKLNIY
jgi:twitching motility protein PilT